MFPPTLKFKELTVWGLCWYGFCRRVVCNRRKFGPLADLEIFSSSKWRTRYNSPVGWHDMRVRPAIGHRMPRSFSDMAPCSSGHSCSMQDREGTAYVPWMLQGLELFVARLQDFSGSRVCPMPGGFAGQVPAPCANSSQCTQSEPLSFLQG